MNNKTINYLRVLSHQYKSGKISRYKYEKELDWVHSFIQEKKVQKEESILELLYEDNF